MFSTLIQVFYFLYYARLITPRLRYLQRMRFRIKDIVIQTDQLRLREDEIKVFEGLGNPEALQQ